jgi:hypothetical protein
VIVSTDDPTVRAAADSGDWARVASLLAGSREPGDVWLRTLTRNLECARLHRPSLYEALQACQAVIDPERMVVSEERRITDMFAAIEPARKVGRAIAVAGAGDGRMLRALARFAPNLTLGREQEIDVIEPDPARMLGTFASADLTGPRGPIEQRRFAWYVGDAWEARLTDDLLSTPTKIPPQRAILGGAEERLEVDEGLARAMERLDKENEARAERIKAVYAQRDDAELLAAFSSRPPRKPRVLLITSQFTSVLQYSTYDSADAFRQLGWETRIVTEVELWHLMTKQAIVAAIDEFEPDLVFQIDHLRYELADAIPPALPFVCWIQDHLVNLTNTKAGDSIGERDFVLTGGIYRYAGRYGYPRRQCVDMPKVARPPVLPTSWPHDREDLLYVSHWSSSPETIIVETCNRVREFSGIGNEAIMRACTSELTRVYADGGSMRSDLEVRGLVRGVFSRIGERLEHETERFFVDVLFQRLNNAFYRQQSLLWAGKIADEFGLKLGIYGHGWEKHPELGRFARGVVKYGPDLEALTRQSKILLQLEPYACYTHQRMLDCVLTGGFALIRDHILNTLPIRIRKFLDAHVPPDVNDVATARTFLDGGQSATFDTLIAESQIITDLGDLVEVVRGWQRAGTIGNGDEALPHLEAIKFDTFEGLRERVKHFIAAPVERAKISADQRASVLERLTYKSAIGRAMKTISDRLHESLLALPLGEGTRTAEAA